MRGWRDGMRGWKCEGRGMRGWRDERVEVGVRKLGMYRWDK